MPKTLKHSQPQLIGCHVEVTRLKLRILKFSHLVTRHEKNLTHEKQGVENQQVESGRSRKIVI